MDSITLKTRTNLKNGEYTIVRILGIGGFGITYEAEQVSLGRRVAVKEFFMKDMCNRDDASSHVSVPSVGSKELVEKFKHKFIREAKMIAGLDNDNIVKIHDVFEENGTAYYVMEYLGGGSLADVVKSKGALSEPTAVNYIRQIAEALVYLHEKNILHLDIKPSNVLLNQKNQVKLIDFGISKHYDEDGSQTSSTPIGISKGYAPLEQYQQDGDVSKFTPATDIYALGATLYFLVTGTVPPDASEVNEEGLPTLQTNISVVLNEVIAKAMSPRKKDRFQNIGEFLLQLKRDESQIRPTDGQCEEQTMLASPHNELGPDGNETMSSDLSQHPKYNIFGLAVVSIVLLLGIAGYFIRFSPTNNTTTETEFKIYSISGTHSGHDYVDLGLPSGLKWATADIGAASPETLGYYFAWGETSPKDTYTISNYIWGDYRSDTTYTLIGYLKKYNSDSKYGVRDNITRLEMKDDAARQNWGGMWRIPSAEEFVELKENCDESWVYFSPDVRSTLYRSKINGNSIVLFDDPQEYQTTTLIEDTTGNGPVSLSFYVEGPLSGQARWRGALVRPVFE